MKKFLLVIGAICVFLLLSHACGLRINVTPSLARGIYMISDSMPNRGDMVTFCISGSAAELAKEREYLQAGSCPSGLRPLLKQLAAIPADTVIISENGISCLPPSGIACHWPVTAKSRDSLGRPVDPASIAGIVPAGFALVLTEHSGGFDSRYFGLVSLELLKKVEPLFIF